MTTKTSIHNVGDRVTVKPGSEHDEMTKGKTGTIIEISTPALGVKFDGMEMVHKWYADDEVEAANEKTLSECIEEMRRLFASR